ncbi:hypothetical protein JQC92_14700 [Shewanella sp. 202IG2-18]|uniref:helix-turn-helix transcriptional regulator n=1 Tax=Parashewanella hymeniacidonis TaxID=2807618 RepID=UPI00195FEE7C|nr:hypothetical protein [Parashewanella hymeniacidonis]MBM7073261.1 hypothetical protein [Parashewanella hymeniacidonis]
MNAENNVIEAICKAQNAIITKLNEKCQNLHNIVFSRLDLEEKTIQPIPSNYLWHLKFWEENLDENLPNRLQPGVFHWDNMAEKHKLLLSSVSGNLKKIEIRNRNKNIVEIISFGYFRTTSLTRADLFSLLHHLSHKSREYISTYGDKALFPLRYFDSNIPTIEADSNNNAIINDYDKFNINNITLTKKEVIAIELLMQFNSIKEIASKMHCSHATINKRLNGIKVKLGCFPCSNSKLYQYLNYQGVIGAISNMSNTELKL